MTDIKAPDLTRTQHNQNDWVERMVPLELHVADMQLAVHEIQQESKHTLMALTESHERLLNSASEKAVLRKRIDDQSTEIDLLNKAINMLEKTVLEIKIQNQALLDFSNDIKKIGWIVITAGGVVVWWFVQHWLERNH